VVSQPAGDAERYRCACLRCTPGLAGRGDGYQCGLLDWVRSSDADACECGVLWCCRSRLAGLFQLLDKLASSHDASSVHTSSSSLCAASLPVKPLSCRYSADDIQQLRYLTAKILQQINAQGLLVHRPPTGLSPVDKPTFYRHCCSNDVVVCPAYRELGQSDITKS